MKENNDISKDRFLYENITLDKLKYQNVIHNINNLNKDFKFFIGNYKYFKKAKIKISNVNTQMTRILKKLKTTTYNQSDLIKSLNVRVGGKNRRFMSAKEIEKFRSKKSFLLRFISDRNKNNKTFYQGRNERLYNDKMRLKKIKSESKFIRTFNGFKNYKKIDYDNRTSLDYNTLDDIHNINNKKINYDFNRNSKKSIRLINPKLNIKNSLFNKSENDKFQPKTSKNNNIIKPILNNYENDKEKSKDNDNKSINIKGGKKRLSINSLDLNNNNIIGKDKYKIRRKIDLNKLKLKVDKFENSYKYYPNYQTIYKNILSPFSFQKRSNLTQLELNIFNKEENNRFLRRRMFFRKLNSIPKLNLNKSLTPSGDVNFILIKNSKSSTNADKDKIIIKKINLMKKRAYNTTSSMKNLYKNKNYSNKLFEYFYYDEGKKIDKMMDKEIKKDTLEYKKHLGNFMHIDGKFFFENHYSQIKLGGYNNNKL